jgi:hypothetical protein
VIEDHKVMAFTPWGRRETASILFEYLKRDHARGVVDEWLLCLNTDPDQIEDLAYALTLAKEYDWITALPRPAGCPRLTPKQRNTGFFYRYMTDPNAVYVRFDDDIVYVDDLAISRLVRHKLETPEAVCSFPVMWNNAIVTYFLQQAGIVPLDWGRVNMYCMDPIGWADGNFGIKMHGMLLDKIEKGDQADVFLYQDYQLPLGLQFSVSTFACLGSTYAGLHEPGVLVPHEEESWHTVHHPRRIGQPNTLVGNALVSHYTFFPQQGIIRPSNVLDRYRALAERL